MIIPGPLKRPGIIGRSPHLRLRQGLQALQEHHEGESVRDKVPVPQRAPYGAVGARRLDVDVRVLLPVPLKPPDLVRRSGGTSCTGQYRYPAGGQRNGFPKSPATRQRCRGHERLPPFMDTPVRMTNPGTAFASGAAARQHPYTTGIAGYQRALVRLFRTQTGHRPAHPHADVSV